VPIFKLKNHSVNFCLRPYLSSRNDKLIKNVMSLGNRTVRKILLWFAYANVISLGLNFSISRLLSKRVAWFWKIHLK